jgi:hypothetical protein
MIPTITRRSLIAGGTSAATVTLGFPLSASAQQTITVAQFRALSARLTGADVAELDATAAAQLLDGFLSLGRGPDLASLAADTRMNAGPLADDIVAAWYSGRYASRAGVATIDLTRALVWNALPFTKPPGVCGGETGYWAKPPET